MDTILGKSIGVVDETSTRTIPELLEKHEFHGSTDGLILLRLARKLLGPSYDGITASARVYDMMDAMHDYVSKCDDAQVSRGIAPLPGVLSTLNRLASEYTTDRGGDGAPSVACGLVTGNVEGIARRKMRALGIHGTNAFTSLPSDRQIHLDGGRVVRNGVDDIRFLGGFGSDYCSACIDDPERNYLDRGEQIAICVQRCLSLWNEDGSSPSSTTPSLRKIIHVGDAPADILAAKSYVDNPRKLAGLCVGVVGVATGSYSAEELRDLCGERVPGVWEPVVLEQGQGVGDEEAFLKACGLI